MFIMLKCYIVHIVRAAVPSGYTYNTLQQVLIPKTPKIINVVLFLSTLL